jgi:hypothetical protein
MVVVVGCLERRWSVLFQPASFLLCAENQPNSIPYLAIPQFGILHKFIARGLCGCFFAIIVVQTE